jgi:hypothetical protein
MPAATASDLHDGEPEHHKPWFASFIISAEVATEKTAP